MICIHEYINELMELIGTLVFVVYFGEGDKHK